MDNLDVIRYLAISEARRHAPRMLDPFFQPSSSLQDGDACEDSSPAIPPTRLPRLPQLCIYRDHDRRYRAIIQGSEGHDNVLRAPIVCNFLETWVLPYVDPSADVKGVYPIELHDSYTYLDKNCSDEEWEARYSGALVFSKNAGHRHTIALPDPYQMCSYSGILQTIDTVPFNTKKDAVFFAGTTTGSRNPLANARLQACAWALDKRPDFQFFITQVAQMAAVDVDAAVPRFATDILRPWVPISEHFNYKYLFNIKGNTCCWSRLPMVMASNSLLLNLAHADITWYYPAMRAGQHFVDVPSIGHVEECVARIRRNQHDVQRIVHNAKDFVRDFCGQVHAAVYTKQLLETLSENKA